jgi:hypothetical protein
MNKAGLFYKLLKIICIISTVTAVIMYFIQYHTAMTNPRAVFDLMHIHVIVTRIWTYMMGILLIVKACFLFKDGKLIYIVFFWIGLLIIIFSSYIAGFFLFPFYIV